MADADFSPPIQIAGDTQPLPFGTQRVTSLQGRPVSSQAPTSAQALAWDAKSNQWEPTTFPNRLQPTDPGTNKVWGSDGAGNSLGVLPPGYEVGYNQITSTVVVTATASGTPTTIINNTTLTFDGAPVNVEFFTPFVRTPSAAAGNAIFIGLYESNALVTILAEAMTPAAANMQVPVLAKWKFTPTAGSHTYAIGAWASVATGTPEVAAGPGLSGNAAPAYLRFTKV